MDDKVEKVRQRIAHSISYDTARAAGPDATGYWMTQADIQQFVAGKFLPDPAQISRLAFALGVQ